MKIAVIIITNMVLKSFVRADAGSATGESFSMEVNCKYTKNFFWCNFAKFDKSIMVSKWSINVGKMTRVDTIVVIDSIRLVVLSSACMFILDLSVTSRLLRLLILIGILTYRSYMTEMVRFSKKKTRATFTSKRPWVGQSRLMGIIGNVTS